MLTTSISSKLLAFIYDTTNKNSGIHNGIAIRLEREFGFKRLKLPCRHHILEVALGGIMESVYGESDSPNESTFQVLCNNWENIDPTKYNIYRPTSRMMKVKCEEVVDFCNEYLSAEDVCREDYKEFLTLAVIYLGNVSACNQAKFIFFSFFFLVLRLSVL